jgi:hypothetical protein
MERETADTSTAGSSRFWLPGRECPCCGGPLVSDGRLVWCVLVEDGSRDACGYGLLGEPVLLESLGR